MDNNWKTSFYYQLFTCLVQTSFIWFSFIWYSSLSAVITRKKFKKICSRVCLRWLFLVTLTVHGVVVAWTVLYSSLNLWVRKVHRSLSSFYQYLSCIEKRDQCFSVFIAGIKFYCFILILKLRNAFSMKMHWHNSNMCFRKTCCN